MRVTAAFYAGRIGNIPGPNHMASKTSQQISLPRGGQYALLVLYIIAVSVAVAVTTWFACGKAANIPEFAQAGDTFGYLQMAADIRRGTAPHDLPRFTFDSTQSRLLLDYFQSQHSPLEQYQAMLGPNAYHYHPETGLIVNQYPPGVGLLLALFPPGHELHTISGIVAAALLSFAAAIFGWVAWRGRRGEIASKAAAAGFVGLAVMIGLLMFGISVSYSIDFFCLPLLLIFLAIHFALRRNDAWGFVPAFIAGSLFGFLILSRLAAGLFVFGFLTLLWQRGRTGWQKPAIFLAGAVLVGIIPLMIHQNALTGSPFRSTYSGGDTGAPSLEYVAKNAAHYFSGDGSTFSLIALIAIAVFYLLLLGRLRGAKENPESTILSRYALALPIFWAVPTAFFLTHPIATDYYQLPTLLVCLFAMAFGVLGPALAGKEDEPHFFDGRIATASALIVAITAAWYASVLPPVPTAESIRPPVLNSPAFLRDPRAWIFADRFTGTLWYYDAIPAHEILFVNPDARWQALQFIANRGDTPFLLVDNPAVEPVLADLAHRGAKLIDAGAFGEQPVVKIIMPQPATR
jgi:hypothetical protein